jgi:hypothetical protein
MSTVIYRLLQLEDPFREEAMDFLFQFGRGIDLPAIIYSSGHLTVPSRTHHCDKRMQKRPRHFYTAMYTSRKEMKTSEKEGLHTTGLGET